MRCARLLFLMGLVVFVGCKASEPGKVQSSVMTSVKQNVTIGGKDWKNAITYTPEVFQEGQAHFGHHCQVCHGLDGQNTGVPFATRMSPPVADLKSTDVQGYSDGQLKWIIENGIEPSGMPGWKNILSDDEMWKIVHFMRHLPAKGSLGVPDVFKEESEKHEAVKAGATVDESKPHTHTHKH
ncbi:MAG TPA: cytochrome c [Terriglobales bacterium]|nr:cytochrome c [Terriglobales bacterium]